MTPDERAMEEKLKEAGGVLEDYRPRDQEQSFWLSQCDCLVDALFGVGLSRSVEGDFLWAVQEMQVRPGFQRVCPVTFHREFTRIPERCWERPSAPG